jgi:hypothetical protein
MDAIPLVEPDAAKQQPIPPDLRDDQAILPVLSALHHASLPWHGHLHLAQPSDRSRTEYHQMAFRSQKWSWSLTLFGFDNRAFFFTNPDISGYFATLVYGTLLTAHPVSILAIS